MMDPHERQSQPEPDEPEVPSTAGGGRAASTGSLAPPDHNTDNANANANVNADVQNRDVSPPRQSAQPATPMTDAESTEYFPPLDVPPSLMQAPSHAGSARPPSHTSNVSSSMGEAASAMMHHPSIRIRRRSSSLRSNRSTGTSGRISDGLARLGRSQDNLVGGAPSSSSRRDTGQGSAGGSSTRRPRSISQPEQAHIPQDATTLARHSRRVPQIAMPRLTEEGGRPSMGELGIGDEPLSPARSLPEGRMSLSRSHTEPDPTDAPSRLPGMRRMSRFIWPRRQGQHPQQGDLQGQQDSDPDAIRAEDEYNERLVDYLDTIDPEVQTLSTLTNVQNSLFVPDLGKWVNRRPTYSLSDHDIENLAGPVRPPPSGAEQMGQIPEEKREEAAAAADTGAAEEPPALERSSTITSRLTDSHYAALPHGRTLEGWTAEEKRELDDHVRHMMHSRRSKFKRTMKGFGQYVRRPLGFLVTLYATLITLFGLAWVLFLIGWIYVGDKQLYVLHIIDSVLVALFAIMGDGLAPFRAIDTYHMIHVLHYARIVKKGCKERASGPEKTESPSNEQQSTDPAAPLCERTSTPDLEAAPGPTDPHTMHNNIVPVLPDEDKTGDNAYEDTSLTDAQQKKLHHHQKKLAKSHSFYKPNETATHYAFPLRYLVAIVILLDCHSCLQISLGATTWGIDYRTRPIAITTVILCVSITCNITAGVIISIGDRKTRKKDVWKLMVRQELTGDAMKAIEEKRRASNSNSDNNSSSKMAGGGGGGESDVDMDKSKEIAAMLSKLAKKPSPEAGEKSQ